MSTNELPAAESVKDAIPDVHADDCVHQDDALQMRRIVEIFELGSDLQLALEMAYRTGRIRGALQTATNLLKAKS